MALLRARKSSLEPSEKLELEFAGFQKDMMSRLVLGVARSDRVEDVRINFRG
jgi:hypothetical protein